MTQPVIAPFVSSLSSIRIRPGEPAQPIHADDVARCFVRSLAMPETVGQTYELCGPDRFTFREMLNVVAGKIRVSKMDREQRKHEKRQHRINLPPVASYRRKHIKNLGIPEI